MYIPSALYNVWEGILYLFPARPKYGHVQICGFSSEASVPHGNQSSGKVYVTPMYLYTVGVLPECKQIEQSVVDVVELWQ